MLFPFGIFAAPLFIGIMATLFDNIIYYLPFILLILITYHIVSCLMGDEGREFREECRRRREEVHKQLKKRMEECHEECHKECHKECRANSSITETKKAFHIEVEMPGVKKEDIKVETDDNELTVTAVRNARVVEEEEEKKEEAPKPVMEYKKKYILPESADMSSVMAKYEDGILILYIEKKGEFVKEKKNIVIE